MTWTLTASLEEQILEALESGESLNEWCKVAGRPSRSTILRFQRDNPEFDAKCRRAREAAGHLSADEQKEIIDKVLAGKITSDVARVVLSAMQWRASKLAPKSYGDKLDIDFNGKFESLTDEQLRAQLRELAKDPAISAFIEGSKSEK